MNEQMMQFIAGLAPDQQQQAFAAFQQQQQQPEQNPNMGLPGQTGDPRAFEDYEGQRDIVADQQAQAEQLRGTDTPQGMNVGNQFVAANPLSHIATAGSRIMGNLDAKKAAAEKARISEQITDTQQGFAEKQLMAVQAAKAKALQNSPLQGMANTQELNPSMGA